MAWHACMLTRVWVALLMIFFQLVRISEEGIEFNCAKVVQLKKYVHPVTTCKGQREFETKVSQNLPKNLTSCVPKLSQVSVKL